MRKRLLMSVLIMIMCLGLVSCGDKREYGDASATRAKFSQILSAKDEMTASYEEHHDNYLSHQEMSGDGAAVLMVYMIGSNLESDAGLASEDIEEMQESDFYGDNLKVVICTGGADYWWNDDISPDEVAVYEVRSGRDELDKKAVLDGNNMAKSDTLTSFIDYVYDEYPADCYSLILWNHGGGAVLGYGNDENYGYASLSLSALDDAMSATKLVSDGNRFEWVGFDACLMGMLEVADLFEPYANYLIASEELIPGEGWDYEFLNLISDGTSLAGDYAGEKIIDTYAHFYDSYRWYKPEYSLACMDLSRTYDVMDKFNAFIEVAENDLISGEYSNIARQRGDTKAFGIVDEYTCYDTVDLYNLSENMSANHPTEAAELQAAISQMIVYERSNIEHANGISIYFPYENKTYVDEWVDEYSLYDFSETYLHFVRNFTETLSGNPLTKWELNDEDATVVVDADVETPPEESVGDLGSIGNFSIQLTPEQVENFAKARLEIWEIYENQDNGSYGLWINSSEVSLSADGVLSSMIANKRFVLRDSAGNQADCCAIELERGEGYAVYYTVVFVTTYGDDGLPESSDNYKIQIRVDNDNLTGVITGIYPFDTDDDNMMPNKQTVVFEQGSVIEPFSFGRVIKFNDDGTLAPFDEWENYSGLFYGFTLDGDISVDMVDIDPDIEKLYIYSIIDTQGNSYVVNVVQ